MSKSKSELLNESIVDATELKKAALKNAEQLLLKQYSPKIEEYVEKFLNENMDVIGDGDDEEQKDLILSEDDPGQGLPAEQGMPDLDMGGMGEPPQDEKNLASPEQDMGGEEKNAKVTKSAKNTVKQIPLESQKKSQKVVIKLGATAEPSKNEMEGEDVTDEALTPQGEQEENENTNLLGLPEGGLVQEEDMPNLELLSEEDEAEEEGDEEDIDVNEIKKILEEDLILDVPDPRPGTITANSEDLRTSKKFKELKNNQEGEAEFSDKEDITKVREETDEDVEDENREQLRKDLQQVNESLVKPALIEAAKHFNKKIKQLKENLQLLQKENTIYKKSVVELRETLEKSNLLNNKLYYKNKILSDPSLNERQKESIVEAITKAESKEKVKTIYEVRKNFLGYSPKKEKTLEQLLESRNYLSRFSTAKTEETDDDEIDRNLVKRNRILAGLEKDTE